MKWVMYLIFAGLACGTWVLYEKSDKEVKAAHADVLAQQELGDPEDKVAKLEQYAHDLEGKRVGVGILLAFLGFGVIGIFFVFQVLPMFAQRITHSVYDSAEMVERDVMHDARSLLAQGDYEGAIEAFKAAAAADPMNRLPWVEIAKVYKDNLGDPDSAIATIRHALENQAWEVNDAAYFLFRLAELYDEVRGDRASAMAIMQQVVDQFPGTRHSANAGYKLHEWITQESEGGLNAEEAEYLARMKKNTVQVEQVSRKNELPQSNDEASERS
ncbi:MAG: tetratricopeptide repeat protein [Gloeobacteraceae cyanobacterium ES-bin-144]|nr:tetratricopeptide repeat protein [Verrucomicrobiales bacterium]